MRYGDRRLGRHIGRRGFPRNRLYLIQGDPGVGKTTLGLQYLLQGASKNERGLYITLSETKEELLEVAHSHGWSLDQLAIMELSAIEGQLLEEAQNTLFHPSEVELNRTTKLVLDEVERIKPARLVFDSLSEMRLLAETPLRYRRQMLALKQFFAGREVTVLLLDDRTSGEGDLQVQSIAHGVVALEKLPLDYGVERRRLKVVKMRGLKFRGGYHDFIIQQGGLQVFPRLVAAEHHKPFKHESVFQRLAARWMPCSAAVWTGAPAACSWDRLARASQRWPCNMPFPWPPGANMSCFIRLMKV